MSRLKFVWFPTMASLWISFHHKNEKKINKQKFKKQKKKIFILKNIINEIMVLKEQNETEKGQKEAFSKKKRFIGKFSL